PLFADLIPKRGGKDVGMDAMLAYYGIPLEAAVAFGDAQNDIDMLRHAGLGVAMDNATDEVKAIADMVTESVEEDGVWRAMEKLGMV
ncbi:MAG: HAD hydrolase family protein, partial [Firmicutes bacterium]|nr:HAD hydrolase family protein [Bacillota bacterium]